MRSLIVWLTLAAAVGVYFGLVSLFGFEGIVALTIHFSRVSIAVAVLILYVPMAATIFREVPAPRRDYLLAGIVLTWLSGVSFSFWNEAGRVFGVNTSIFTSAVAGLFSLFLIVGGIFHLAAPAFDNKMLRRIAIAIGIAMGGALVFIAPLFR